VLYQVDLRRSEILVNVTVLYYMPDYRSILNEFIWQTYDKAPKYPRVEQFVAHWEKEIDARIKEVQIFDARGFDPLRYRRVEYDAVIW
jgi:uncharacterized protein Usg